MDTLPDKSAPAPLSRLDLAAVVAEAQREAAALRAKGGWSDADDAELAARFETAAQQALRVPAYAERSATLRLLARRFVPRAARPLLRRAAHRADQLVRAGFEQVERRVDRGRTI